MSDSDFSVFQRTLTGIALGACVVLLNGCHFLRGVNSCQKPAAYETAEDRPPLKIPPGLKSPDTSQALRIPALNEPEPPPRKKGDPCLNEPPPYAVPKRPPQPAA